MLHGRIVAKPDVFAQATLSRLGETCRNRSKLAFELSFKQRALVLSEPRRGTSPLGKGWPRSSEEGSPKRELASPSGLSLDSLA
ncbi:hypothetical protein DEO72_LG6g1505 [Vigna unguiculata]|uniref:Uncharacterized protein n=1 Tax=Vigna unguiculata TaxID=3917 RepID=A0A4D6M6C5_VIGUN|nr:hypothetical protein DEO72_LG6g1505 [Vigna unguiculata]